MPRHNGPQSCMFCGEPIPEGRRFAICTRHMNFIRTKSVLKSGELHRYVDIQKQRTACAELCVQGGKKNDKLDPNNYLGNLKLTRQRRKKVKVIYG